LDRRRFLKLSLSIAGTVAGVMVGDRRGGPALAESETPMPPPLSIRKGDMLYRTLGSTGEQVSLIGLGGHHIGRPSDEQEGIRIVRRAIDHGITFMDNSWDYHDGGSEIRMGKALRDGYRDKVSS
jgi:hypothetical protein